MGKFLLSLVLMLATAPVFAQSLDFSQKGDEEANTILKEYITTNEIEGFHGDVVSYFYDVEGDGKNEIIGIVKSKLYYTLAGYNLVMLKQDENGWGAIQTDIYFDDSMPFDISGKKISYHRTVFYKHKKAYATLNKSNSYKAAASIKDYYTNKKLTGIQEAIDIGEGHPSVEIDVNDIPVSEQKSFKIEYTENYEKPKYRIEIH